MFATFPMQLGKINSAYNDLFRRVIEELLYIRYLEGKA